MRSTVLYILYFIAAALIGLFAPEKAAALSTDGILVEGYFRVIWGMLVVLGIMLLLYAFVRKRFSLYAGSSEQRIKVIEMKPLMQKKSLCLIEVDGEEYLLGISADRIDHIATISAKTDDSFAETLQKKVRETTS